MVGEKGEKFWCDNHSSVLFPNAKPTKKINPPVDRYIIYGKKTRLGKDRGKMTPEHLPCNVTCTGWLFNCVVLLFPYQTVVLFYLFIFLLSDVLLVVLVCKFVVIKKNIFL